MKVLVKKWDGQTTEGKVLNQCEETGLYNVALSDNSYGCYSEDDITLLDAKQVETKEETKRIEISLDGVYLEYNYELLNLNKSSNVYFIPNFEGVLNPAITKQAIKNYLQLQYGIKQTFKRPLPTSKDLLREFKIYGLHISPSYRRNDLIRIAEYIAFN